MTARRRRVGWRLLLLLWVWALLVFATLDLFLNVEEFDHVRPRSALYHGMRVAAHRMVGEPVPRGDAHVVGDAARGLDRAGLRGSEDTALEEFARALGAADVAGEDSLVALLGIAARRPERSLAAPLIRVWPLVPLEAESLALYAAAATAVAAQWPQARAPAAPHPQQVPLVLSAFAALEAQASLHRSGEDDAQLWANAHRTLVVLEAALPGTLRFPPAGDRVEGLRRVAAESLRRASARPLRDVPADLLGVVSLLGGEGVAESTLQLLEQSGRGGSRPGDREERARTESAIRTVLRWGTREDNARLERWVANAGLLTADPAMPGAIAAGRSAWAGLLGGEPHHRRMRASR